DKVVYQFEHSHQFIVKLTNVIDSALVNPSSFSYASMQTNFNLESEIIVHRYYLGSYAPPVDSLVHQYIQNNRVRISWIPPTSSAPNQYELEWSYIDTAGIHPDSIRYDFRHNSSKVL